MSQAQDRETRISNASMLICGLLGAVNGVSVGFSGAGYGGAILGGLVGLAIGAFIGALIALAINGISEWLRDTGSVIATLGLIALVALIVALWGLR